MVAAGYKTNIGKYLGGIYLNVDYCTRVINKRTIYDLMQNIRK